MRTRESRRRGFAKGQLWLVALAAVGIAVVAIGAVDILYGLLTGIIDVIGGTMCATAATIVLYLQIHDRGR